MFENTNMNKIMKWCFVGVLLMINILYIMGWNLFIGPFANNMAITTGTINLSLILVFLYYKMFTASMPQGKRSVLIIVVTISFLVFGFLAMFGGSFPIYGEAVENVSGRHFVGEG